MYWIKIFFKDRLRRPLSSRLVKNDSIDCNIFINNNNAIIHSKIFELSDFHLICIGDNRFIAFVPLTEEPDKFLCIYFRLCGSINDIVLKLNTIFEYGE